MNEMTLTLNSPITEEQWDALTDVDFDNTNEIYFNTKHGKEVCFVKRKTGKWVQAVSGTCGYGTTIMYRCSGCERMAISKYKFCPNCGADMRGD